MGDMQRKFRSPNLEHFDGAKKLATTVYKKREIVAVTFRTIIRACTIAYFITTCALAFSYFPYHLQIRRMSNVVASDLRPAVLNVNATVGCPRATLESIRGPFDKFTVGGGVGSDPFNADDIPEYKIIKKMIDDGQRDARDEWAVMQLYSRFSAIEEWCLVVLLGLFIAAFLSQVICSSSFLLCSSVGRLKTCMGKCCGGEAKFEEAKKYITLLSEISYVFIGVLCLVVVGSHEGTTFALQEAQMHITEQYASVCAPGMQLCFEDSSMELCDFMRGSVAPGETDSICMDDNFVVPRCDIFGQDKVNAIDVISFGQYKGVGNDCGDNYCPMQETRSTKVTMASQEYWDTGGEGPHLGLYDSFSWDSTQGIIVSMHVFAWLFIATMCIDLVMVLVGLILSRFSKKAQYRLCGILTSCCETQSVDELKEINSTGRIEQFLEDNVNTLETSNEERSTRIGANDADSTYDNSDFDILFKVPDMRKRFKINFV